MGTDRKIRRMKELSGEIRKADTAYFKYDAPAMADREYDRLVAELMELEKETGTVLSGSPTQKVPGELLEGLERVRHSKPMLSAGKTKSEETFAGFTEGKAAVLSWKLDGLTLVLRYRNGRLERAITRGKEGTVGEDVTHTVKHFLNVPLAVPEKKPFEARGEGVISWNNFEKINSGLAEPYSHPRNLAAGSTRSYDASETEGRRLEFIAFELTAGGAERMRKHMQLALLEAYGFDAVPHVLLKDGAGTEKILEAVHGFRPEDYAYPVDGLVIEYDDTAYGKSLGATGHHENRLLALKWEDGLHETEFIGLDAAVTRSGMVSLTAELRPVVIGGTTVSRAYLHNIGVFESLRLGRGDKVKVYKANMVIPQIAENVTKSGTEKLPEKCPCCGKKIRPAASRGGTRQLYCANPDCAAKLVRKFVHFCGRTRMDIRGISEKTLSVFTGKGWLKNFADLYRLERHRDEIIGTEGFGERSFARLLESAENSRRCTLDRFIAAMGIPAVGRTAGREISRHFGGSWDAFEEALESGFDFTGLEGFGETMHENIHRWHADGREAKLWRPLLEEVIFIKEDQFMAKKNSAFMGKTVVATGKLENYTRDGINAKIAMLGGKAGSSVSRKTDFVVAGEKAGSKLAKAREYGIPVLTEQEFERMCA